MDTEGEGRYGGEGLKLGMLRIKTRCGSSGKNADSQEESKHGISKKGRLKRMPRGKGKVQERYGWVKE